MPFGAGDMGANLVAVKVARRRLQPHMLDRVGRDFRPDEHLDLVQQLWLGHDVEQGPWKVERRFLRDIPEGEGEIEVINPWPARFVDDLDQFLVEWEALKCRGQGSLPVPLLGNFAEPFRVVIHQRLEVGDGVKDVPDDDIAILVEFIEKRLVCASRCH